MSKTQENENQQDWLSFFVVPLSCKKATANKKEKDRRKVQNAQV